MLDAIFYIAAYFAAADGASSCLLLSPCAMLFFFAALCRFSRAYALTIRDFLSRDAAHFTLRCHTWRYAIFLDIMPPMFHDV